MNYTLIITSKEDAHADYLIEKINARNLTSRTIRLNTEDFVENCSYSFDCKTINLKIKDSKKSFKIIDIKTVWYRRPKKINYNNIDEGITKFVNDQSTAFLDGLYYLTEKTALWINPITNLQAARSKIVQLNLANKLKIRMPKTVITNQATTALNFAKNKKVINKSLTVPYFNLQDKLYPYLTTITSYSEIATNKNSIEICPTLFQEFIEKSYDVRVIYINNKIFTFAIYSQENEHTKTDFRGASPHLLKHKIIKLTKGLEQKIITFVKCQGLIFSALDFVVDKKGKFYFLENNPNGQWVWLELITKTTVLSDAIIELMFYSKYLTTSILQDCEVSE